MLSKLLIPPPKCVIFNVQNTMNRFFNGIMELISKPIEN